MSCLGGQGASTPWVAPRLVDATPFLYAEREVGGMKDVPNEPALEVLKEQGFEIGESVIHDEHVRIRIRSREDSALVEIGQELWDLAAGRLTLADIARR